MNLQESHRWVIIRLLIIGILFSVIAYLINSYTWREELSKIYAYSLYYASLSNAIAIIVFLFIHPNKNINEDDYKDVYSIGKLSRNIYMFSIIMFFSGLMSFSSSAGRVAYIFFIIGLISMVVAHISYFMWIRKFK
jgi:Na+/H+-dicarboxylate symporter